MKIAIVSPLYESVPPRCYGGTERVVSYLTEELVRQGHDVTLFASGDSVTRARLVAAWPEALRLNHCVDPIAPHMLMFEKVAQLADGFDAIHFNNDYLHFPLARRLGVPHVTTLHGRLDLPDFRPVYCEFRDVPVISISHAQREPLPWLNWQGTVHHGLPADLLAFRDAPGSYLAFLGRISPEKGCDRAVEIARRAGLPLRIAAKVDRADIDYFNAVVKPMLSLPDVEFIGEIGEKEKAGFLGDALALLFPIDWPEPFGLVMIEAFACGTPVIAFRRGSVPEVMQDGRTGHVCGTVDEAVRVARRLPRWMRRECRRVFEERFTAGRMARDYLRLYGQVAGEVRAWKK